MSGVFRVGLVIVTALVVQFGLVNELRLFDAMGDVMLLVAVAAAIAGDREQGAMIGFAAGLAYDLLLTTPFGLSALAYCVLAYAVGTFDTGALRSTKWLPALTVAAASAVGVALYALLGAVVGQESMVSDDLPVIMAVVAAVNLVLALPAIGVMRWALADPVRHRVFAR